MTQWTAIVPIKRWSVAKSRLEAEGYAREVLAQAFAADLLAAVAACPEVQEFVIVSNQEKVGHLLPGGRGLVLEEPREAVDALSSAIDVGVGWARTHRPLQPIVIVPADLPALTAPALSQVLRVASRHPRAFVPDADGEGTTLLTGLRSEIVLHSYGPGSAGRHAELGAVAITDAAAGARQDVDTVEDLKRVSALGVGPHTAFAVHQLCVGAEGGRQPTRSAYAADALPE